MFRFKTKRALIARNDELETIVAKQIDEIDGLQHQRDGMQESLGFAHRAMNTQRRLRVEAEERMAAVVAELHKLRDEIRDAEQEQSVGIHPNLPSATGAGMARPPRPRFDRTAARLRQQGRPADLVEAAADDAEAKRYYDGLGDQ